MPNRNIKFLTVAVAILLIPSVVFGATFGKTTDGGSTQTFSGDRMYLSTASPLSSGTITSATCRNWISSAGSYPARVVIYDDLLGVPLTYLANTDESTISNTTEQANTYNFTGGDQIYVTAGTPYWFGLYFDDPGVQNVVISRGNTAGQVQFQGGTYPTPGNPFVSAGTANGPQDCFITYSEVTESPQAVSTYMANASVYVKDGMYYKKN